MKNEKICYIMIIMNIVIWSMIACRITEAIK